MQPGLSVQTEGVVVRTEIQYRPRRQLVCLIADPDHRDAQLVLRFFTFYPSQQKALQPGQRVRVFGDVRPGYFGLEIVHPQWKAIAEGAPLPDRLTPVYPTTAGLGAGHAAQARRANDRRRPGADRGHAAGRSWSKRRKLWKFGDAVRFLHAPPPRVSELTQRSLDARTHPAWTRLKFDELLAQQLSLKAHRKARAQRRAPVLTGTGALTRQLIERARIQAHARAGARVARDRARLEARDPRCSGCCRATSAPARRSSPRWRRCRRSRAASRSRSWRRRKSWPSSTIASSLRGSTAWTCRSPGCRDRCGAKARKQALAALASGEIAFAVGTHALFQEGVEIPQLGLAIVDEQHRFGVAQRLALRGKGLAEAHQLMMSATPIPRTLAMTFYADLDVSAIDEMPPGRTPVATRLVSQKRRQRDRRVGRQAVRAKAGRRTGCAR